jgi:hypothetical protein
MQQLTEIHTKRSNEREKKTNTIKYINYDSKTGKRGQLEY